MHDPLKRLLALALASTVGACATVTRGTTTRFTVESSPPGAHASTSSGFVCESTPCTFRLPRKDNFTITVSKPGYKTTSMQIESKLAKSGAAGFVGNAVFGGLVGATVDVTTGAMDDLTPNPAHFTLEAEAVPSTAPVAATPPPAPAMAPVTPTAKPAQPVAAKP